MKRILLLSLFVAISALAFAQADSTVIKLQYYKGLYEKGLIDSSEYLALKAKTLGLIPQGMQPDRRNGKTLDGELYYDILDRDKILPAGVYMSLEEIRSRKPSLNCKVLLRIRNTWDYENGVGGNVMLSPQERCISRNDLKMDAWLVSDGVRCFINLEHLKLQPFYSTALTTGRFLAFYKNQPGDGTDMIGAYAGYLVSDISMATGHTYKKLYVIDTKTAMLNPVDREYMLKALAEYPALLSKYRTEKEDADATVSARYLQEMNDAK